MCGPLSSTSLRGSSSLPAIPTPWELILADIDIFQGNAYPSPTRWCPKMSYRVSHLKVTNLEVHFSILSIISWSFHILQSSGHFIIYDYFYWYLPMKCLSFSHEMMSKDELCISAHIIVFFFLMFHGVSVYLFICVTGYEGKYFREFRKTGKFRKIIAKWNGEVM